jgi:hypothetical protein
MASVFISYRQNDTSGHAGRLFDSLRAVFGRNEIFMDVTAIRGGGELLEVIQTAVRGAKILLVVIGPDWNRNNVLNKEEDWIRQEVGLALRHKLYVIPVLVNRAPLPTEIPAALQALFRGSKARKTIELRDDRWDSDIQQLADDIQLLLSPDLAAQRWGHGKSLRILVCHDLAAANGDVAWEERCRRQIAASANRWSGALLRVQLRFVTCADLFESQLTDVELRFAAYELLLQQSRIHPPDADVLDPVFTRSVGSEPHS